MEEGEEGVVVGGLVEVMVVVVEVMGWMREVLLLRLLRYSSFPFPLLSSTPPYPSSPTISPLPLLPPPQKPSQVQHNAADSICINRNAPTPQRPEGEERGES